MAIVLDTPEAELTARIAELELLLAAERAQNVQLAVKLDRERARSAGLERGIEALSARVDALRSA